MRVLIVDDERAARERLAALLAELGVEVAGEADNGLSALSLVRERRPDVVLLDISMPEVDGFEVARHLEAPRPLLIFQTAHDQFAIDAFEHEAIDYLLKPVTAARLSQALDRARRRLAQAHGAVTADAIARLEAALSRAQPRRPPARLLVRHAAGHRLLPLRDVLRFVADERLVEARTAAASFLTDYTLGELEDRLAGAFVRVSRGALVNLGHIERIASNGDGSATLTLSDGSQVRVSRRRASDVKAALA
jgi:DNA-binding LytR/AlgR family response regulator